MDKKSKKECRILLIDKSTEDCELISKYLLDDPSGSFSFHVSANLKSGIEHIECNYIDVVLIDLELPDSSGLNSFINIQDRFPHIPVIILSGVNDEKMALTAVHKGAESYLPKDQIDSIVLIRTIKYAYERKELKEALINSEEHYRSIFETAPVGIFHFRDDGKMVDCNEALAKMMGYDSPSELIETINKTSLFEHLYISEDKYHNMLQNVLEREDWQSYEVNIRHLEGNVLISNIILRSVRNRHFKLKFIEGFCEDITEQKQAENALTELATKDALTGLFNRRQLNLSLSSEIDRSVRYGNPLTLCMADLDHFKLVNDNYGHDVGDDVLRRVARIIKENIRRTDISARYGGEEFCLILTNTDLDDAEELLERIRLKISEEIFVSDSGADFNVTISVGIARFHEEKDSSARLLKKADKALYEAKNSGRNQIHIAM